MAGENETQITVNDLKSELPEQDYDTFTLGEDTVAVRCLLKAKVAVQAMILSTGHGYDEADEVCRLAVLKYGLYELFSFVGEESRARDKYEDCQLLIESAFGAVAKKSDSDSTGPATGAMNTRRENPLSRRRC